MHNEAEDYTYVRRAYNGGFTNSSVFNHDPNKRRWWALDT